MESMEFNATMPRDLPNSWPYFFQDIAGIMVANILGGGFKYFLCSPRTLGKIPNLYVSDGLKPPTSISFLLNTDLLYFI